MKLVQRLTMAREWKPATYYSHVAVPTSVTFLQSLCRLQIALYSHSLSGGEMLNAIHVFINTGCIKLPAKC